MRRPDHRPLAFLLAVALCLTVFVLPAFAAYESDENGGTDPPPYAGTIITIISKEMGDIPEETEDGGEPESEPEPTQEPEPGGEMDMDTLLESLFALLLSGDFSGMTAEDALTPDGNLTLVDDIVQGSAENGKQFLTVTTKNGNYFYLIIDRSGGTDNVHFLNLVDESDLLALMEDGDTETVPASCTCKDRCYAGHVDTSCAICAVNMTECTGKEPEPTPTPAVEVTPEPETPEKKSSSGAAALLLIVVRGGGAAFYFLKVKGKGLPFGKQKSSGEGYREAENVEDEGENEDEDDGFIPFEKSEEAAEAEAKAEIETDDPEDYPAFFPDNGEYWPEDAKDGSAK